MSMPDTYVFMGNLVTIRVPGDATDGAYSVIEHDVPPEAGPPPHSHTHTEVLTVLDGEFEFILGQEMSRAGAGETVVVPPNTVHTTSNVGDRAGRLLSIYAPAGSWGFFPAAGTPLAETEAPDLNRPVDLAGLDMERILALATEHGITPALDSR